MLKTHAHVVINLSWNKENIYPYLSNTYYMGWGYSFWLQEKLITSGACGWKWHLECQIDRARHSNNLDTVNKEVWLSSWLLDRDDFSHIPVTLAKWHLFKNQSEKL